MSTYTKYKQFKKKRGSPAKLWSCKIGKTPKASVPKK